MSKKKILIFSGAGISAESGVKTFRDNDGLWNNFKVEEVATIHAWEDNPQRVLDFYNLRIKEMKDIIPNRAHEIVKELENDFIVNVVTQNVDNLHEKAGSTNVIHLHGNLSELKEEFSGRKYPYDKEINVGDTKNGEQLRPNVTWFGEDLDSSSLYDAKYLADNCDVCIIIGTSMKVAPANSIPFETPENALIYYVDPGEIDFNVPKQKRPFFTHIKKAATLGMQEVMDDLKYIFL